jgi:2-polyprenyl-6-methoxyphenol hydroxylase-like FAD-dependent oxidoreductase
MAYDLITIGGGLGGAALAKAMAEAGASVLVIERETEFRDRVRGEGMHPWGIAEAKELGVYKPILARGNQTRFFSLKLGHLPADLRDLVATSPYGMGELSFFHPEMQETLLAAAETAGAEVRRGETVVGLDPANGSADERAVVLRRGRESARLVVGADGRSSKVRDWGGFETQRDVDRMMIAGVLMRDMRVSLDTVIAWVSFGVGIAILFPIDRERTRAYYGYRMRDGERLPLTGAAQIPEFLRASLATAAAEECYAHAAPVGPLAEFAGADTWVDHPYRDGVVLVGDAAGATDPIWGCGLSLTLRDVRVLRDRLLASDDWGKAADAYASERDHYYRLLHRAVVWLTELLYDYGPEADARRLRAEEMGLLQNPSRMPDVVGDGPETHTDDVFPEV